MEPPCTTCLIIHYTLHFVPNHVRRQFSRVRFGVISFLTAFQKIPHTAKRKRSCQRHMRYVGVAVPPRTDRWRQRRRPGTLAGGADRTHTHIYIKKMGVSESGSIFLGTARCVQTCSRLPMPVSSSAADCASRPIRLRGV